MLHFYGVTIGRLSFFPFSSMTELGWSALVVTGEHLQNLVSQGYMIVAELATCHVPTDPTSPTPVAGYIVVCSMSYERGFGEPSHRFLCSLLQLCGLELHHLTPLGILHITAFVTMCESYMGIEPHFNLWNYIFHVWLQLDSDVATAVWGCAEIYVHTGPGIDP
jgi:hypothetical protein